MLTWPDAIDYLEGMLGWTAIRARNRELGLAARDRLCAVLGIAAPAEDSLIGSLVTVPIPVASRAFHDRLFDGYRVQAPVFEWNGQRLLRVAMHVHTDLEDVEALAPALVTEGLGAS